MTQLHASRLNWYFVALVCGIAVTLAVSVPPSQAAAPPLIAQTPEDGVAGQGAGLLSVPEGVAADPSLPGHVYVADAGNKRISEYNPWGEFVKAWGWGVRDGSAELQTCTVQSTCRSGLTGAGAGQFAYVEAVAVDGSGMVYTIDALNHRILRFDPTGGPGEDQAVLIKAFGEAGSAEGQLAGGQFAYRSRLAACGTDDSVFIGGGERIQRFSSDGAFLGPALKMPSGKSVRAIATDGECNIYVAYEGESGVHKISPVAPFTELAPSFTLESALERPSALAVDSKGNLYANSGDPRRVQKYDKEGICLTCGELGEGGKPGFDRSPGDQLEGVATTNACGADSVYIPHFALSQSFLRAYEVPNPAICPPPLRPPTIAAQYAVGAETTTARILAEINPHFWAGIAGTTNYYVQWGTSECIEAEGWEGPCAKQSATPPGRELKAEAVNEAVPTSVIDLEGLEPATDYSYRFVAISDGGGPVYGEDPDSEGPGEASPEAGVGASFTTYRAGSDAECPANAAYRASASAALPDCRAYELVSPLDKEGGDIVTQLETTTNLPAVLVQSSVEGDRFVYGSYRSFGDAAAAPYTSQYIAARQDGAGWRNRGVSPPASKFIYRSALVRWDNELKALSPDLCTGWLQSYADPPLAPGAPPGYSNLYRRTDNECGGPSFVPFNTVAPPVLDAEIFRPTLQGLSADGQTAIFRANDAIAPGAAPAKGPKEEMVQLYAHRGDETRMLCVEPGGLPLAGPCTPGQGEDAEADRRPNLTGAISADGESVFWTASSQGPGPIYLRTHPFASESARSLGTATAKANLTGPATGKGNTTIGSPEITSPSTTTGSFAAGQEISGPGIPPEAKIVAVGPGFIELDKGATATASGVSLVAASKGLKVTSILSGSFAPGQTIIGPGIPFGTTVMSVSGSTVTISAAASSTNVGVQVEAFSPCMEPDKACTVPVSEEAEALSGASGSYFQLAAEDGSRVLFTTGGDLYEYSAAGGQTNLIAGEALGAPMGASEDATRVYLVSKEAKGGVNPEGESAVAGKPNLYYYEGGEFRFVGKLEEGAENEFASAIAGRPVNRVSRVAADGLSAAFTTASPMTGYDNRDVVTGEPQHEVYLYDAAAGGGEGELICVSCNPSGARPQGAIPPNPYELDRSAAARLPVWQNSLYASRNLSDDGRRLFFTAQDALAPKDTNGREDVYQWEAPGKGDCTESSHTYSPRNGGCVDLISSGRGALDATFLDASPSGNDVFFTTISSLVPHDFGLTDVYDARVDGGLPSPQAPPPACEGEACQGAYSPPGDPAPASSLYRGPGNVEERPAKPKRKKCRRGKVKRGGKCVKRKKPVHGSRR